MTEQQTVDLAVWLTRIWDEEERLARDATDGPWAHDGSRYLWIADALDLGHIIDDDGMSAPDLEHIAAHDPASMLARIAADRKILARYKRAFDNVREHPEDMAAKGALLALHGVVADLASPYKGREGWQESWGHE